MSADDFLQHNDTTYDLQKLKPLHNEILRKHFRGWKQKDIAESEDVTLQTVRNVIHSTLGQEKLQKWEKDRNEQMHLMMEELRAGGRDAVETLLEMVDEDKRHGVDATNRRLAAQDILDRLGMGAASRSENLHLHLSDGDDLEDLKEKAIRERSSVDSNGSVVVEDASENENNKES